MEPHAALRFAEQIIAAKATRYHIYGNSVRDDIAQTALLSVLTSLDKKKVDGLTGGLIANAVKHAMAAAIAERTGVKRPEDIKALRKLDDQIEAFIHEHGREPTAHERDEFASQIRDAWPDPRHRPLRGYQARVVHEVLEASRDAQVLRGGVDPAEELNGSDELSELDEELASGRLTKDLARLRVWNAIAKAEGLPLVNRQLPPWTNAGKITRAVTAAGGLHAVARRYLADEARTPAVDAMLMPFDIRCRDDALDIARLLVSRGTAARFLWKAATDAAAQQGVH